MTAPSWTSRGMITGFAVAVTAIACHEVLGIRDDSFRVSDALPRADAAVTDVVDDGAPCVARGTSFCASLCPIPAFCDDFEGEEPTFTRWKGGPDVSNPLIQGQGTIAVVVDPTDGGLAIDRVLSASADSMGQGPAAAVLASLNEPAPTRRPRAARASFWLRVQSFEPLNLEKSRFRTLSLGGLGSAAAVEGVSVTLVAEDDGEVSLGAFQTDLDGQVDEASRIIRFSPASLDDFTKNWLRLEVVVGARDAVEANTLTGCTVVEGEDAGPAQYIASLRLGPFPARCGPLGGKLAAPDQWAQALLVAGATVSNHMRAAVLIDDVAVDFID